MRFNEDVGWIVHGRKCQGEEKGFYGISANSLLVWAVCRQLPKDLRNLLGILVLGCIEPWATPIVCARLRRW